MELKLNRKKMEEREGMETEGSGSRQQGHELLGKGNSPKLSKAAWARKYNCRKTTLHERLSKGESTSNLMQSSYKIREEKEQSAFTTTLT